MGCFHAMSSRQTFGAVLALSCFCLAARAHTETKLDFWHSYNHQPDAVLHYSFQIAKYKRGLFFGSCGPSTRSLQWEYDIDLAGTGPTYDRDKMSIASEGKPVDIVSGTVVIDREQKTAAVTLRVNFGNSTNSFKANGVYRLKKFEAR